MLDSVVFSCNGRDIFCCKPETYQAALDTVVRAFQLHCSPKQLRLFIKIRDCNAEVGELGWPGVQNRDRVHVWVGGEHHYQHTHQRELSRQASLSALMSDVCVHTFPQEAPLPSPVARRPSRTHLLGEPFYADQLQQPQQQQLGPFPSPPITPTAQGQAPSPPVSRRRSVRFSEETVIGPLEEPRSTRSASMPTAMHPRMAQRATSLETFTLAHPPLPSEINGRQRKRSQSALADLADGQSQARALEAFQRNVRGSAYFRADSPMPL